MLATNRIHLDLNNSVNIYFYILKNLFLNIIIKKKKNKNNYIVSLALVALSEICTAEMCRELFTDVTKLFSKTSTYLKKKTALCCAKIIKKIPEVN